MKKCFLGIILAVMHMTLVNAHNGNEYVTIAILAKDKEATLPLYLSCIEAQTWPKEKTYIYIRTNNNRDETVEILQKWIDRVGAKYAGIYFDASDNIEHHQDYQNHEWNGHRCKILAHIRQLSIIWAFEKKSHYFVVDCDNFIKPHTLEQLLQVHVPVVAPLLKLYDTSCYANYHAAVDEHGYLATCNEYFTILQQSIKGLIQVPVVHCAYLVRYENLPNVVYDDDSYRYEYVIFSDMLRRQNIPQYIDNRDMYGYVSFAETSEELYQEPWIKNVESWVNTIKQ